MDSTAPTISFADVELMVSNGTSEDLHLEYKSGRPVNRDKFKEDIAQDASAFANSDGGRIIIGVVEKDHRPVDLDGVDENQITRESLGQVIEIGRAHV